MSYRNTTAAIALIMTMMAWTAAYAQTGAGGCSSLPEYYRALGALQGMASCDMSVERAQRIVGAFQGTTPAPRNRYPAPEQP